MGNDKQFRGLPTETGGKNEMRIEFDLPMPSNPEAERAVLGACLVSKTALESTIEILRAEDFYDVYDRKFFEVLSAMYSAGKPADFVTVQAELEAIGR